MALVLQGIRVLDITDAVSGPFATMLLGGYGAEVIKIESHRHLGFRESSSGLKKNQVVNPGAGNSVDFSKVDTNQLLNPSFSRHNLDKLSVTLNLTKPEGRDLFKRLLQISDVVVDNLSFGTMQNWGFDYQALCQIKSDIIVASLPSLGQGIHEHWTTWGMNLLAYTGFTYYWGHPGTPMEERAASSTYGDYIAGMAAVSSILAALYHRELTGEGQYIEVCQAEVTASLLGTDYLDYFINNRISPPGGNRHPVFAPYNSYRCKGDDRWCVIAVFNEDEWQRFCCALDYPGWVSDPKFENMESRLKYVDELDENIEIWTRQHTPHQVMNILQSFGIKAGAAQNSEDLFYDPQLRSMGHMLEIEAGQRGKITFDGPPLRLSAGQKTTTERAPLLGEHNDYVYRQLLGLTQEEVNRLIANQVIF